VQFGGLGYTIIFYFIKKKSIGRRTSPFICVSL